MCILYNDSPRFMDIIPKDIRNLPLFFQESREIRYRFHGPSILREPSKAPCRSRPAFWPGSSLQKAILLPTGCVCFEQEKRGPVYPHLVQLTLEDFSAFSIIIVTGTKAFCKGLFCPLRGAFLFCQNAEGAASGEDFIWFAPPPQTKTKQAPRHHAEVPGGLFLQ